MFRKDAPANSEQVICELHLKFILGLGKSSSDTVPPQGPCSNCSCAFNHMLFISRWSLPSCQGIFDVQICIHLEHFMDFMSMLA